MSHLAHLLCPFMHIHTPIQPSPRTARRTSQTLISHCFRTESTCRFPHINEPPSQKNISQLPTASPSQQSRQQHLQQQKKPTPTPKRVSNQNHGLHPLPPPPPNPPTLPRARNLRPLQHPPRRRPHLPHLQSAQGVPPLPAVCPGVPGPGARAEE